ncbi:hypothetical protein IG631_21722 [Alternaria alternata]|nr:hypothetical protein IG631_21722 [Alternaria alternata]
MKPSAEPELQTPKPQDCKPSGRTGILREYRTTLIQISSSASRIAGREAIPSRHVRLYLKAGQGVQRAIPIQAGRCKACAGLEKLVAAWYLPSALELFAYCLIVR